MKRLKRLKKNLIARFVLLGLGIFSIANCATGPCNCPFEWAADPYVADHNYVSVINADEKEVKATEEAFDDFTCFTSSNISELKYSIERLKLYRGR